MSTKDNGGPAFPNPINPAGMGRGMTLRDYFAAKAMQGLCSDERWDPAFAEYTARAAYMQADAMLKARNE